MSTAQGSSFAEFGRFGNTAEPHWRVYPVSVFGELVNAALHAVKPFRAGIWGSLLLLIALGLLADEGLLGDLGDDVTKLALASAVPGVGLVLVVWVVAGFLSGLQQLLTSRALARAIVDGASMIAVPHPSQAELVDDERPFRSARVSSGVFGGLWLLIALGMTFSGYDLDEIWPIYASAGIAALPMVIAMTWLPGYFDRQQVMRAHWTERVRDAAAQRAVPVPADDGDGRGYPPELAERKRRAGRWELAGIILFALAYALLHLWEFVAHPGARTATSETRVQHIDAVEAGLDVLIWIVWAAMTLGVAAMAIGYLVDAALQREEKRMLWHALENPAAARPPAGLLLKYSERQPIFLAQCLAFVAGIGSMFASGLYLLGTDQLVTWDAIGAGSETFGRFVPHAQTTLAVSLAMVALAFVWHAVTAGRGAELRSQVVLRWPVKPAAEAGPSSKKLPDNFLGES